MHWASVYQMDQGPEYVPGLGRRPVGLGKSAGASDFLLKAMGTHRRVSK